MDKVKIRTLKPMIKTMQPLLRPAQGDASQREQYRQVNEPWRKWYRIARWRSMRMEIFERDGFICQMCGKLEGNASRLVCDHIEPHKGDPELFWDKANLQCLCTQCHDGDKRKIERNSW